MHLSPIARRVKIRITSGGTSHADLDSLLRHFSISDLSPLVADGRLSRWLVQIGESTKAALVDTFNCCSFMDADSIENFLHIFFDFNDPTDLAARWSENSLEDNLKNLKSEPLLKSNLELALYMAQRESSEPEANIDKDLWVRVLNHHKAQNANSADKIYPLLEKFIGKEQLQHQVLLDFKANIITAQSSAWKDFVNQNFVEPLKYWLTNIRLIYENKPNILLASPEESKFFNLALFLISRVNKFYYSKTAEDSGQRYKPSMIMYDDKISALLQEERPGKYMQVLRLIADLCKREFIDDTHIVEIGDIPGLDWLSDITITPSSKVKGVNNIQKINTLSKFCMAPFRWQIIYIVTNTLLKQPLLYYGN